MWKVLAISIAVAVLTSSVTATRSVRCDKSGEDFLGEKDKYMICKDLSGTLSVFTVAKGGTVLDIRREGVSFITDRTFKNIEATTVRIIPSGQMISTPTVIQFSSKSFQTLPFVKMIQLSSIKVQGSQSIFEGIASLDTLQLDANQFKEFPRELCAGIPNLRLILLMYQQIKSLSAASFHGINEGLLGLAIKRSGLESIEAKAFARFPRLRMLSLRGNRLEILEPDMFEGIDDLRNLFLTDNELREIKSGTFSTMKNLTQLWLSGNHLESLSADVFRDLTNLHTLELRGNKLINLPDNCFMGFNKLKFLTLDFKKNVTLPKSVFSGLNLIKFSFKTDELSNVEAGTFDNATTHYLELTRNGTINFKPKLFTGLKVHTIKLYEKNETQIDKQAWGLPEELYLMRDQPQWYHH